MRSDDIQTVCENNAETFKAVAVELDRAFRVSYRGQGSDAEQFTTVLPTAVRRSINVDPIDFSKGLHHAIDGKECRLPDDWVYWLASRIACHIAESDGFEDCEERRFEIAESCTFIYTTDAMQWLCNPWNRGLVDEADEDLGRPTDKLASQAIEHMANRGVFLAAELMIDHLLGVIGAEVCRRCSDSLTIEADPNAADLSL